MAHFPTELQKTELRKNQLEWLKHLKASSRSLVDNINKGKYPSGHLSDDCANMTSRIRPNPKLFRYALVLGSVDRRIHNSKYKYTKGF